MPKEPNKNPQSGYPIAEVIVMDKKELEQLRIKKFKEMYNNATNKTKVENQNQEHNTRKEGITPINQKR